MALTIISPESAFPSVASPTNCRRQMAVRWSWSGYSVVTASLPTHRAMKSSWDSPVFGDGSGISPPRVWASVLRHGVAVSSIHPIRYRRGQALLPPLVYGTRRNGFLDWLPVLV